MVLLFTWLKYDYTFLSTVLKLKDNFFVFSMNQQNCYGHMNEAISEIEFNNIFAAYPYQFLRSIQILNVACLFTHFFSLKQHSYLTKWFQFIFEMKVWEFEESNTSWKKVNERKMWNTEFFRKCKYMRCANNQTVMVYSRSISMSFG